jgi:hypothetical protein
MSLPNLCNIPTNNIPKYKSVVQVTKKKGPCIFEIPSMDKEIPPIEYSKAMRVGINIYNEQLECIFCSCENHGSGQNTLANVLDIGMGLAG